MIDSALGRKALLTSIIVAKEPELVQIYGLPAMEAAKRFAEKVKVLTDGSIYFEQANTYVRSGLRNSLLAECGLAGAKPWLGIGLGSNNGAVTLDTRFINGATAGLNGAVTGQNVSIKAATPTISTDTAGANPVAAIGANWTVADFFNNIPFTINKVAIVLAVPASNAVEVDGNVVDIVGGGGTAPYDKTIGLNIANAGLQTLAMSLAVTAVPL